MKVAYIAHPIGGAAMGNVMLILKIVKMINLSEPDTVPFAPYVSDCLALDDETPIQRERGFKNDIELFNRGFIDEVRLYGDHISPGMKAEIELAHSLGIPVVSMTLETRIAYARMFNS